MTNSEDRPNVSHFGREAQLLILVTMPLVCLSAPVGSDACVPVSS